MLNHPFHLPLLYLTTKHMDLTNQSAIMAIHTLRTPMSNLVPKRKASPILNIHMDATPITMVYVTSLTALRAFGSVKDTGHIIIAKALCKIISSDASCHVASDNAYIFIINGVAAIMDTFIAHMAAYDHFSSFIV